MSISLKAIRKERILLWRGLAFFFFLFWPSTNWMKFTHIKEVVQSALLGLPIYTFISSKNTFKETPRMFEQVSGHLVVQTSWHMKLTITGPFSKVSHSKIAFKMFLNISNSWPLNFKIIFYETRETTSFNYFADTFLKKGIAHIYSNWVNQKLTKQGEQWHVMQKNTKTLRN